MVLSSLEQVWIVLAAVACGAAVGWGTNALAVWMLFKPERFVGHPPWLGWQGVIPRRSVAIARACLDASLHHLHGLEQVVRDLDPDLLARHIVSVLDERVEELVDEVMDAHHPVLWENLPRRVREQVYAWVRRELPRRVNRLVDDIAHHADDLVDFYEVLEKEFGEHPERMAELFRCAGQHTFERLIAWGALWGGCWASSRVFCMCSGPRAGSGWRVRQSTDG
ncbi:hypothetical protein AAIA72_02835 [Hahella sp. SMD15-11]|uniref:DUF445 family protein n=1 Tax=Thermohahella caldifontis TaxID=3142973 RepID=A0AB39UXM1_9GAMM